jgi:hypothetical protein
MPKNKNAFIVNLILTNSINKEITIAEIIQQQRANELSRSLLGNLDTLFDLFGLIQRLSVMANLANQDSPVLGLTDSEFDLLATVPYSIEDPHNSTCVICLEEYCLLEQTR